MKEPKKSFVLYTDQIGRAVKAFNDNSLGAIFRAIFLHEESRASSSDYCTATYHPDFERGSGIGVMYDEIEASLDRDAAKYAEKSDVRAQSGKKGAERRWKSSGNNTADTANANDNIANAIDNDNENEKENEKDTDKESENVKKGPYGRLSLSEGDYALFCQVYPDDADRYIEELDAYAAREGKHYDNALAALHWWAKREADYKARHPEPEEPKGGFTFGWANFGKEDAELEREEREAAAKNAAECRDSISDFAKTFGKGKI